MKQSKWNDISLINDTAQICWSCIQFFKVFCFASFFCIMKVEFCYWVHSKDFRKQTKTQRVFFPPWSHQVRIHIMLSLLKLHTYQSSPFFHLHWSWCHRIKPSQWFVSSNSNNCSQNLGTAFLLVWCFPLYLSLLQAVVTKRGTMLISHAGKVSFLPSPVMGGWFKPLLFLF